MMKGRMMERIIRGWREDEMISKEEMIRKDEMILVRMIRRCKMMRWWGISGLSKIMVSLGNSIMIEDLVKLHKFQQRQIATKKKVSKVSLFLLPFHPRAKYCYFVIHSYILNSLQKAFYSFLGGKASLANNLLARPLSETVRGSLACSLVLK